MKLPTEREIEELHRKYAPSPAVFDLVFIHCQIVAEIAAQLIEKNRIDVDAELVRVGCLVHDIGLYQLIDKAGNVDPGYVKHGVIGEALLKSEGYPEVVCRFASHHTGVGLTRADVQGQNLPLPPEDYLAETDEETLVMYADKFHSKKQPPTFVSYDQYREYLAGFGEGMVEKFELLAQRFGIPDLSLLILKYGPLQ